MNLMNIATYLIIMIAAGILGGIINYFFQQEEREEEEQKPSRLTRCVTIGIGASFIVPLFLYIIQSDLIKLENSDTSKIFVFMGFCLLAAIYSRKFLTTISERILKEAKDAKDKAKEVEEKMASKDIQHSVDSRVLALLEKLLIEDPDPDAPEISAPDLKENIKSASVNIKTIVFSKARAFRLKHFEKSQKIKSLIPVFEALIESDNEQIYHRNHAQLAYILKDMKDPDFQRALDELNQAIMIRQRLNIDGFSAYEFNRAMCRIHMDEMSNPVFSTK